MAENGSGGGVVLGEEKAAAPPRVGGLPRPTITLPPRSSFESLFRDGAGGSASGVSPGPLTLVSSFFAEDPESDGRSFTQLLVGAINSPVAAAAVAWRAMGSAGEQGKEAEKGSDGGGEAESNGGLVRLGQNRPPSLAISQPQMFTLPPGFSPGSLLDSPALFSPALGKFAMSHQEALAQVTAQAVQCQSPFRMLSKAEFSTPFSTAMTNSSSHLIQEVPTLEPTAVQSAETSQSDQVSPPNTTTVDKPAHDGYNWRKYGQKVVRGSEYPRSYYKCTHPKCTVKKKVEHSAGGQVTEIIYKGQHDHERPLPSRRVKEVNSLPSESNGTNGKIDKLEPGSHGYHGNLSKHDSITGAPISRRDQEPDHGTPERLSESSDSDELTETRTHEGDANERDPKRRNIAASSQKTLTEPRIIVQTTSEVDLLDDGYRWRKYGQKVVKGNPHPRSYYKCTHAGCNVRKHIERSPTDPTTVITSYEGKHNHDIPAARSSSHYSATASNSTNCNPASLVSINVRDHTQTAVAADLKLKEEYENT